MANTARKQQMRDKNRSNAKAAMKTTYAGYRDSGNNSKRKKIAKAKSSRIRIVRHKLNKLCGNPACRKCYEEKYGAFLRNGQPINMPQSVYQRWINR